MTWRIGQTWGGKESPLLVTIVEEGTGTPDAAGRRPDDRLIGCAGPNDAELIVRGVNRLMRERAITLGYGFTSGTDIR